MAGLIPDDYSALTAVGSGIQGFAKGLMAAEEAGDRRADREMKRLEFEAKMKADQTAREQKNAEDAYKKEKDDQDLRLRGRQAGLIVGPKGQPFDPGSAPRDPEWVETQTGLRQAGAGADPYGTKALNAEATRQGLLKNRAEFAEKERVRNSSPVPGYKKGESYVADPIEERGLREGAIQVDNFNKTLDTLKQKVKGASKVDLLNPYSNVRKSIKKDLRDLQLTYKGKAFAELGVLAGPDLQLLEQIVEDPSTLSNIISGKEGVSDRYSELQANTKSRFDQRAQVMGLVPTGLIGKEPSGGGNGLIKATVRPAQDDLESKSDAELERLYNQKMRGK